MRAEIHRVLIIFVVAVSTASAWPTTPYSVAPSHDVAGGRLATRTIQSKTAARDDVSPTQQVRGSTSSHAERDCFHPVFTARCYAVAPNLLSSSVRLCVKRRCYIKTAKHRITQTASYNSLPGTLVFRGGKDIGEIPTG